jgi:hypothetical protein
MTMATTSMLVVSARFPLVLLFLLPEQLPCSAFGTDADLHGAQLRVSVGPSPYFYGLDVRPVLNRIRRIGTRAHPNLPRLGLAPGVLVESA